MKKVGIIALVLVVLLGSGATLARAKADKADLVDEETQGKVGWVIVNKNAAGEIIVQVHVHKGQKNTLFYVFIKNINWSWSDDTDRHGVLNTNGQGNGNFHGTILSSPPSPGELVTWVTVLLRPPGASSLPRYSALFTIP